MAAFHWTLLSFVLPLGSDDYAGGSLHTQRRIASLMRYLCSQVEVAMSPKVHGPSSWVAVLSAVAVRVALAKIPLHPS